jgi:hypothetical protein
VALQELMLRCDTMDCQGITQVLREAVSGFANHEVRHDHIWVKQGRVGKRRGINPDLEVANVKTLFPASAADG